MLDHVAPESPEIQMKPPFTVAARLVPSGELVMLDHVSWASPRRSTQGAEASVSVAARANRTRSMDALVPAKYWIRKLGAQWRVAGRRGIVSFLLYFVSFMVRNFNQAV